MTVRRNLIPIVCNFSWFSIFYTLQPETFKTNVRIFSGKFFEKEKLSPTFASSNDIEPWCNGNTTDSGPVIPGSNPGGSTRGKQIRFPFFFLRIFLHRPPCEKPGPVCGRFERRAVRRPAPPGPARLSQIPHRLCTQNESFRVPDCFPVRLRSAALRPTARNRTFGSAESFAASEAGTSDRGSRREQ